MLRKKNEKTNNLYWQYQKAAGQQVRNTHAAEAVGVWQQYFARCHLISAHSHSHTRTVVSSSVPAAIITREDLASLPKDVATPRHWHCAGSLAERPRAPTTGSQPLAFKGNIAHTLNYLATF